MQDSPRSVTHKDDWPNHTKGIPISLSNELNFLGYKILNAIGKGYFGIVIFCCLIPI